MDDKRHDQEATLKLMGYKQVSPDEWESPECVGGRIQVVFRGDYVNTAALDGNNDLRAWSNANDARVALAKLQQALQHDVDAYQSLVEMTDMARRPDDA